MDLKTQISIFLRSFLIQAGWNFEKMQNLGFAFSILPGLRKIWKNPADVNASLRRHMNTFNTQPYMSGFVLGLALKLEGEAASGGDKPAEGLTQRIGAVKQAASSALAAIGDTLFWGILKPFYVEACLLIWLMVGFSGWIFTDLTGTGFLRTGADNMLFIFSGIIVPFAAYNGISLWVRWRGLILGYQCGNSSGCGLDAVNWQKLIRILKTLSFCSAVVLAVLVFHANHSLIPSKSGYYATIFPGMIFFGAFFIKKASVSSLGIFAAVLSAAGMLKGLIGLMK